MCLTVVRNIFNSVLRLSYFPAPWEMAQIKMIPKPGKDPHDAYITKKYCCALIVSWFLISYGRKVYCASEKLINWHIISMKF